MRLRMAGDVWDMPIYLARAGAGRDPFAGIQGPKLPPGLQEGYTALGYGGILPRLGVLRPTIRGLQSNLRGRRNGANYA